MDIVEIFSWAFTNIKLNKLRSLLTMLGIIIGITSITLIVAIGDGHKQKVMDEINKIGTDVIWIEPHSDNSINAQTSISLGDISAIKRQCNLVVQISPIITAIPPIQYQGQNATNIASNGVNEHYFSIMNIHVLEGRWFSESDVLFNRRVCVLERNDSIRKLLDNDFTLPKNIMIRNIPFSVIGFVDQKGKENQQVFIPYSTMISMFGNSNILSVCIKAKSATLVNKTIKQVRMVLDQRYRKTPFRVSGVLEYLEIANNISNMVTLIIVLIAGISLLVGGIGIMNIMLVSVTERTKEIGILKAIGADEKHILVQFLIEAIVLSSIGGFVGILCGVLLTQVIKYIFYSAIKLSILSIIISSIFSVVIGILSGFYPALKASRLSPIEAIRR